MLTVCPHGYYVETETHECFYLPPSDVQKRIRDLAVAFCDCGVGGGDAPHETEERNCQYIDLMQWLPALVNGAVNDRLRLERVPDSTCNNCGLTDFQHEPFCVRHPDVIARFGL